MIRKHIPSPAEQAQILRVKLVARRGDWKYIADQSGIGYSWLSKFGMGQITNPTVTQLQALHEYLEAS